MSLSPVQQARQALGTRLREIRIEAGLTGRELGRRLDRHASKVSRIEHGRSAPSPADIRGWCEHCHAIDQTADLLATLQALDEAWIEWRRSLRSGTAHRQREQIKLEADASLMSWYEPTVVPGILHTADYARGVLSKVISFLGIPDDLEEGVARRLQRQQGLHRGTTRFHLLLGEQALYTRVGDESVMAGQLDRVLAIQGSARVHLGVLPREAAFEVLTGGFILFDTDKVMVETVSAELTITQPREIALYVRAFARLKDHAVYGKKARQLITRAIETLG